MEPPSARSYPPPSRAWYAVGVLTLIYVFSFIDRQILNLLVKPIRRDLGITDTQMSLLMGFSFAVFYTFFGIPIAVVRRETNGWKWPVFQFAYMFTLAWVLAFLTWQGGKLLGLG